MCAGWSVCRQGLQLDVAGAGLDAVGSGAALLLCADSLAPDSSGHERSSQARRMAAVLQDAAAYVQLVARCKRFTGHRVGLTAGLCAAYADAGERALAMLSSTNSAVEEGAASGGTGEPQTNNVR